VLAETLIVSNCMKARWIMGFLMDGVGLLTEMAAISLANLDFLQQMKVRNMIKMESKFMKRYIQFSIDLYTILLNFL
jgi:hypothetical protein